MGHCAISHLIDSWLSIGAETALGSECINHIEFPYGPIFLNKFVNENKSVRESDEEAYMEAGLAWRTADLATGTLVGYTNIGCEPFTSQECCLTINKIESSKKVIGGNSSMKFFPLKPKNPLDVLRDILVDSVSTVVKTLAELQWAVLGTLQNIGNNTIGTKTKRYKFINYKYKDCDKRYLYYNGSKGSQLQLRSNGTVFTVRYKTLKSGCRLAGGYQIRKSGASMTYKPNNNNIVMEDISNCYEQTHRIDDDETWFLWDIGNKKYVLLNWGSKKVLDAHDTVCDHYCDCSGQTSNMINGFFPESNDPSQVWILEEVN
ncbi:MAG: hypothetical protein M3R36_04850 [Bacteroidota bacterium]|nr:hypothetical protein [Bacteroidota bacterium]